MTKLNVPDRGALESTVSFADGPPVAGLPADGHIGRYVVRGAVGTGGMGIVVAAYDPELDRQVAIKLVATEREESRARLVREAQAMARLSHPNVVTVHEVVRVGDRAGIVMELVDGEDLAAWRDGGPRPWRQAVELYIQAARGLAAAHRAGIVHRDFKPSNVLLGKDGVVRVTDFGLARSLSPHDVEPAATAPAPPVTNAPASGEAVSPLGVTLTRTGALVGTPAYMAPEQHLGATVDARTDQWALACSLYEALYGERPFAGDGHETLRANVMRHAVRPAPSRPRVPRALRVALLRALSPRPDDRFADMDALIAALSAPARRASRITAGVVALVALAAIVVAAAVIRRSSGAGACAGLDAPLAAEWNPTKARRLRDRLLAAGRTAAAADGVLAAIDEFGRQWTAARGDACVQTRQGVRSADQLDRRMRCLDQHLVELSSVIDGLTHGDARAAATAGDVVDRLHPVSDCDDPREAVAQPASRAVRDQIAEAERQLARAWAAEDLDQYQRALPLARAAAEVGRTTGWAPLEARALLLVGDCQQRHRDFKESLATLDRAASVAAAAKDDLVLAEVLSERFFVLDEDLGRRGEALDGRTYVELALVRAGNPPALRARWLHFLAAALYGQHQEDEALADEVQAVAIWRKITRPGSATLLDSLETEANIQVRRKQFAEAETLLREVIAGRIAARGPDDPLVASAEDNFGVLEFTRYHLEPAIEHWQRAAQIGERSGTLNWRVHSNLGAAHTELGQLRAAAADFERARAMVEREAPGDSAYAGECATSVGSVLTQLGQFERARPLLEQGLEQGRKAKAASLAIALFSMTKYALLRGDVAGAAASLAELVKVDEDANDPMRTLLEAEVTRARSGCRAARAAIAKASASVVDDPFMSERMEASLLSAQCHVDTGEPARAITELEPDIAWLEQHHADAEAIAPARFTLARALAASGGDRTRAHALAEQALPALFGVDHDAAARWLARDAAP